MTAPTVTINPEQRLYVIPCSGGYSCLGFDVAEGRMRRMLTWLQSHDASPVSFSDEPAPGTPERYARFEAIQSRVRDVVKATGQRCEVELSPQLIGLEGRRVEVVSKFGERRRFRVGKSTGWMPIHLELKTRRSFGGMAADREYQSVRVVG